MPPRKANVMAIEQTLILCKPDAVARGLVGEIVARFERRGYVVAALKMLVCDKARAEQHYAEHKGKPFYDGLVSYITSAPLVALVVAGAGAVDGCRSTIGATDPIKAAPGSIRGDHAQTIGRNLVHGSDSTDSALREIPIWFGPDEIVGRRQDLEHWIIAT